MECISSVNEYPIVLRFEGMWPSQLRGYEAHRTRKGGDLGHVDCSRSELNRRLIGAEDWASRALAEVEAMKAENFAAELESLHARNRHKDIQRRVAEGPHDPWRSTKHGPLREVILTANKEWFDGDLSEFLGEGENQRVADFERLAVTWLKATFGDDVIHARADLDEQAYHIHAVVMPRVEVEMTRTDKKTGERKVIARRKMLQPSKFPEIRDYELAQDSVGAWFKDIGLVRGERRKQAIRDALQNGKEPPKKRRHVRPAAWRAMEEKRLAEKETEVARRERYVEEREQEAEAVLAFANGIAEDQIDEHGRDRAPNSRKTAIATFVGGRNAGFEKARRAFRAAFRRLRSKAENRAQIAAAQKVAADVAEIREADEIIVSISRSLPEAVRHQLAKARRTLSARLIGLERRTSRAHGNFQEKSSGARPGEKF